MPTDALRVAFNLCSSGGRSLQLANFLVPLGNLNTPDSITICLSQLIAQQECFLSFRTILRLQMQWLQQLVAQSYILFTGRDNVCINMRIGILCLCRRACTDRYTAVDVDVSTDVCTDVRIDVRIDMRTNVCTYMYTYNCVGMNKYRRTDMEFGPVARACVWTCARIDKWECALTCA